MTTYERQYEAAVATVRSVMAFADRVLPVSQTVREHYVAYGYVFDVRSRGKHYVVGVAGDKVFVLHRGSSLELACN